MPKEEYITTTAKELFLAISTCEDFQFEDNEELINLAKTCAKCAEAIWKIAHSLQ